MELGREISVIIGYCLLPSVKELLTRFITIEFVENLTMTHVVRIKVYHPKRPTIFFEELHGPLISALRRAIAEVKQRWTFIGWVTKIYHLELLRASEGTLSCWSRLHLQSLAPTNSHWARVVRYGTFSLCVIHKEGLCPSNGGINRLMMMMIFCLYVAF
jgi:hypothetical protein